MSTMSSQRIGLITGIVLAIGLQFMPLPDGLSRPLRSLRRLHPEEHLV